MKHSIFLTLALIVVLGIGCDTQQMPLAPKAMSPTIDSATLQKPSGNAPGQYSTVSNGNSTFTITIQPNGANGKDTHIADERLDGNGGQLNQMEWQMGGTLPVKSGTGRLGALLIRFDVSAIPASANILQAEATLYKHDSFEIAAPCPTGVVFQRNVYRLLTDWDEGSCNTFAEGSCFDDASWNRPKNSATPWNGTRPATDSDVVPASQRDYDATPLATNTSDAAGFTSWDVIDAVEGWVDGSFLNHGLVFRRPSYVQVQCPSGARIERFWSSEYSVPSLRPKLVITYSLSTSATGFVLCADGDITLARTKESTSAGDVHANGDILVEKGDPSAYDVNLTAAGTVTVEKENTILGDVTAGTAIVNDGVINGAQSVEPVDAVDLPDKNFSAGGADETAPKDGMLSLVPGSYGTVTMNKSSTLKLTSGDYFFEALVYNGSESVIEIDLAGGAPVTVNVVSNLELGKEIEIRLLPNGEADSDLVTFCSLQSHDLELGKEARFLGTLTAPAAKVIVKKNTLLRGAICAREIEVERDCLFLHHSSSGSL